MTQDQVALMMFAIYATTFLPKWLNAVSAVLWGTLWLVRRLA